MQPIALTCGEPAGIGPEIAVAALKVLQGEVPFFWIGDPWHLPDGTAFQAVNAVGQVADVPPGVMAVMAHPFADVGAPGRPVLGNAQGVIDVIARAVGMAMAGEVSAICTAPINKKALKDGADFAYPGHTEYLAALAGVDDVVMMLACPELRVVPATIHIPICDVAAALTAAKLEAVIRLTHAGLVRDFGIAKPRLAIAGLNPHAGEGGAIGVEEQRMIIPLLDRLRAEGFSLLGPMPGDTMFHAGARAKYDAAICMYHDQALIPIKTIDFAGGVNVTLGLPFIRTSPDHGTAFDIAGKGVADPTSLVAALRMAKQMVVARG
jgi:4-hydroxythreonine-4-phosphate dehydrogenase